ncbi:hypothetical protein AB0C77_03690 [Streptomyces sp. NPDC048629]|uniref:hypothetical protein n=1 Tax=Streptomyces sp. NPDC048629 TaxID=3154824 RepID=UPI00344ACACF
MSDSVWTRFRRHRWLPQATAVAVLAAVFAGYLLVRAERRADHNEAVLARACGGALPAEILRGLLPDDSRWRLRTGPGPRALMACSVTGEDEDDPRLEIAAVPVLNPSLEGVTVDDVAGESPYDDAPEWADAYEQAEAQVTVACPKGLRGYARPVTAFRVHGSLLDGADAAAEVGTAVVALAEDLRERNGCGGKPVRYDDAKPGPRDRGASEDEDATPEPCRWFRPADLGRVPGGAPRPAQNGMHGGSPEWARGCTLSFTRADGRGMSVSSASWWGVALPEVRTEYGAELAGAGRGGAPAKDRRSYEVAAWAESVCADGRTLHRVSTSGPEPTGLTERADALLDRYLASAKDCRGTKRLGKVWAR